MFLILTIVKVSFRFILFVVVVGLLCRALALLKEIAVQAPCPAVVVRAARSRYINMDVILELDWRASVSHQVLLPAPHCRANNCEYEKKHDSRQGVTTCLLLCMRSIHFLCGRRRPPLLRPCPFGRNRGTGSPSCRRGTGRSLSLR